MPLGIMNIHIVALVFIVISRLKFPSDLPMVEVLCKSCGADLVKTARKLEKTDSKYRKLELDLDILQTCQHNSAISKILQFNLENRDLRLSSAHNTCQEKLLKGEIKIKKNKIK